MKKRIGMILTALALLVSNAASIGCMFGLIDEPIYPNSYE